MVKKERNPKWQPMTHGESLEQFKRSLEKVPQEKLVKERIKTINKYGKPIEKGLSKVAKGLVKAMPKKVLNRKILKKSPQATYTISSPRSSSFQKEWKRENLLGWR